MDIVEKLNGILRGVSAFGREVIRPKHPDKPFVRPKIGIALGGGFARGLAHVGVLRTLEEAGIPIDFLAGTSSGAIIAAMYASGMSGKDIQEVASLLKFGDLARFSVSKLGLWNNDKMAVFLRRVLKVDTFEDLRIPLAVSATEFSTGESVIFSSGPLIDAVRASCAYPGMFLPVQVNGRMMVDGLLAHPVPAAPLKQMGAEKVISVHFTSHWVGNGGPKHFMDVIGQCFSIAASRMCGTWQKDTDLAIEPDVSGFAYDAFQQVNELVKAGEESALAALPVIREWLRDPHASGALVKPEPVAVQLAPSSVPIIG